MLDFKLPEIGENIASGTVTNIMVAVGDAVHKGDDLIELETEKASLPVPSPADGVIKEILINIGDEVAIGSVIFKIDAKGTVEESPQTTTEPKADTPLPQPIPEPAAVVQPVAQAETQIIKDQNVVVIGGGPGGYAAAFRAADLGQKVTLIDLDVNPGGVCLYRGCMPSKALLHAAKILSESKEAEKIGITFGKPKVDLDKLRSWKDDVVNKLTGGLGILSKQRKITFIQGRAKFINSNTVEVDKADGKKEKIEFDKDKLLPD